MPETSNKPVIFLTFANAPKGADTHLRNLSYECDALSNILDKPQKDGLCEVVVRSNVTIDDVFDVFGDEKYRDRIAVFHFAGHADSYRLAFQSAEGSRAYAHQDGLVPFLARQKGLTFVFLNGCATREHVVRLIRAGVPAAAGTYEDVNDDVAADLSIRFYKDLAGALALDKAWENAVDYVKTVKGKEPSLCRRISWEGKREDEGRFPWFFQYNNEEMDKTKKWTLIVDPLFGLPPIPKSIHYPELPYRHLQRYEREHAKIFFGRSSEIRELYHMVTRPERPPVILLHGQSGVGKSSLLEAGLLPRLESSHTILYKRRNREKGLQGTLEELIKSPLADRGKLSDLWKQIESQTGKPLVVILDQAEEIFTDSNKDLPYELDEFTSAVRAIFDSPGNYPRGRLILGYRKEYPEIEDKLKEEGFFNYSALLLKPLNGNGIMEVVTGLEGSEALKKSYNLKVEEGLPDIMTHDLSADKSTPVAPVLQIILTGMWETAKTDDAGIRAFTTANYRELKKNGLAMKDFFRTQIEELGREKPDLVNSGLALDLLKFHTTEMGTARYREIEEIGNSYDNNSDVLEDLVRGLKKVYLLTDTDPHEHGEQAETKGTSLAHDTLAPVVVNEYNESDRPGQRAGRILAAKIGDFERDKDNVWLDEADLEIVEQGKEGMKSLNSNEEELLEISRKHKLQRERVRKRNIGIGVSLIIVIIVVAVFAVMQWNVAEKRAKEAIESKEFAEKKEAEATANKELAVEQKKIAEEKTKEAIANKGLAEEQKAIAEKKATEANARRLAVIAETVVKKDPTLALRIAEKAWRLEDNKSVTETIYKIYRENSFYKIIAKHKDKIFSVAFSPDGKTILTGSKDNTARLWDLQGNTVREFKGHTDGVTSVAFSPDGKTILTGSGDNTARLWDLQGNTVKELKGHADRVLSVAFSPDGKTILTGSWDNTARLCDLQGNTIQEFKGHTSEVSSVAFSPDGKTILTGSWDSTACLWDLQGNRVKEFKGHNDWVFSVVFSPDGKTILTGSKDNTARLWNLQGKMVREFKGHIHIVSSVAFAPDGKTILTGSWDNTARLWDLQGTMVKEFKGHNTWVSSLAFSPNGKTILTSSYDSTARLWDLQGNTVQELKGHTDNVTSVAFSPAGKTILTGSDDNTARLWDLQGNTVREFKGHSNDVLSVAFSPDGQTILTGSYDSTARLWDLKGNSLNDFKWSTGEISSMAFSPDGKTILTGANDSIALLWNLQGKRLQMFYGHNDPVSSVAFSPDGKIILTGTRDHTACLWNLQGKMVQEFKGHSNEVLSVAFSPDGQTILTGSADKTARLWDLRGNIVQEFKGHSYGVTSVAFSPDGKTILTGSADKTARLWDLRGNIVQEFKGHSYGITSVAFSPDGKTILTGSWDKTARLWQVSLPLEDFLKKGNLEKLTKEQKKEYGIED